MEVVEGVVEGLAGGLVSWVGLDEWVEGGGGGGQVLGEGVAGWAGACGVVVGDLDEDLVEVLDDVFDVLCFCDGELVGGWFGWGGGRGGADLGRFAGRGLWAPLWLMRGELCMVGGVVRPRSPVVEGRIDQ